MKGFLLLASLIPYILSAQVFDDFSDGELLNNPTWFGDLNDFEVNSSKQLHLKTTGTDTSYLSTQRPVTSDVEWNFWIKLSFNSSVNNYAKMYLVSDNQHLKSSLNGYFIQIGGNTDSLSIYSQDGVNITRKSSFLYGTVSHSINIFRIKVTREGNGLWELYIDTTGGQKYLHAGTFLDNTALIGTFCGFYCRYTSSNATKFYFDDFYTGDIRHDTIRPMIHEYEVLDSVTIRLQYSEPTDLDKTVNPAHYLLIQNKTHPAYVSQSEGEPNTFLLSFSESMSQGFTDSLSIHGISDLTGNIINDTILLIIFYKASAFDILISEILADPEPPKNLPEQEFIELFNRSNYPICLKGWQLLFSSSQKEFPTCTLPSHGFLILEKDSLYREFGKVLPLFTSTTSLSNEGTIIILKDEAGHVIHSVQYSVDWYGDSYKKEGGWSLEMIDTENPCGCSENWKPSESLNGGTPGGINSVHGSNPDLERPYLIRAAIIDSTAVRIWFSESIDSSSFSTLDTWTIEPGPLQITRLDLNGPDYSSADLLVSKPFQKGMVYHVNPDHFVQDCAGNRIDTSIIHEFGIPDSIQSGDIIINEALTNPYAFGKQFVELYNRSEKILDIQDLLIGSRYLNGEHDGQDHIISNQPYLLFPDQFVCLSEDPVDICYRYQQPVPDHHLKVGEMPSFNEDSGSIVICLVGKNIQIDSLRYTEEMHFNLLVSRKGVALERIDPEGASSDPSNWHSAAESEGFGTPGRQNSQYRAIKADQGVVHVEPPIFSPDNDGINDIMVITISGISPDARIIVTIFDVRGRPIRSLTNGVFPGENLQLFWDGTDDQHKRVTSGFYILLIECYDLNGKKSKEKIPVAVINQY